MLEHITYTNEDTGYTVARVATDRGRDPVTVVGPLLGAQAGEHLHMEGRWRNHPLYGRQFEVGSYRAVLPATVQGIRRYLGSGLIRASAPRWPSASSTGSASTPCGCWRRPGAAAQRARPRPHRTGRDRAGLEEQKAIKDVMVFLQGVGVSTSLAVRIYKAYREEAVSRSSPTSRLAWPPTSGASASRPPTRSPRASASPTTAASVKAGFLQFTLSQASELRPLLPARAGAGGQGLGDPRGPAWSWLRPAWTSWCASGA